MTKLSPCLSGLSLAAVCAISAVAQDHDALGADGVKTIDEPFEVMPPGAPSISAFFAETGGNPASQHGMLIDADSPASSTAAASLP